MTATMPLSRSNIDSLHPLRAGRLTSIEALTDRWRSLIFVGRMIERAAGRHAEILPLDIRQQCCVEGVDHGVADLGPLAH